MLRRARHRANPAAGGKSPSQISTPSPGSHPVNTAVFAWLALQEASSKAVSPAPALAILPPASILPLKQALFSIAAGELADKNPLRSAGFRSSPGCGL